MMQAQWFFTYVVVQLAACAGPPVAPPAAVSSAGQSPRAQALSDDEEEKPLALYTQAMGMVNNGNAFAGIELLTHATTLYPRYRKLYRGLGIAYCLKNAWIPCFTSYRFYLQLDPPPIDRQQATTELANLVRKSVALQLFVAGEKALRDRDFAHAVDLFNQVLDQKPEFALVHRALGSGYADLNLPDESIRHYRRYLELAGNAPDTDDVRGIVRDYETQSKDPSAIKNPFEKRH